MKRCLKEKPYDFDRSVKEKPTCGKLLYDCPMYNMKAGDEVKVFNQEINEQDLLRYGEYLTDDEFYTDSGDYFRVRIIKYINRLYYHKMVDDDCIEFKELK